MITNLKSKKKIDCTMSPEVKMTSNVADTLLYTIITLLTMNFLCYLFSSSLRYVPCCLSGIDNKLVLKLKHHSIITNLSYLQP